jgi:hypothetical protein
VMSIEFFAFTVLDSGKNHRYYSNLILDVSN